MSGDTLVSVCIPTFNGARWAPAALDSALAQTYENIEILVVDNASTDETLERVAARDDERVRIVSNPVNLGAVGNHDESVRQAQGSLVKFLHQDDLLHPDCVRQMAAVFAAHPTVGLVFAPREIVLDDPSDSRSIEWSKRYDVLHDRFEPLGEFNRGTHLLDQYLPALSGPTIENWIGEPSSVMVKRSCFAEIGLFNHRIVQAFELETWLRVLTVADAGFVDERLSAYRHHSAALSAEVGKRWNDWLDLLWLYEGLLQRGLLRREDRELIQRFRRRELVRAFRRQAGRLGRGNVDLRPFAGYLAFRARGIAGRQPRLHDGRP